MTTPIKNDQRQTTEPRALDNPSLLVNVRRKAFSDTVIFSDLQFSVKKREFISVVAPSGAGKTTLLRLIAGLDTDYEGEIYASGKQVVGPGIDRGIVFQESRLLPWLTVEANVSFALSEDTPVEEQVSRRNHVLEVVGLLGSRRLLPYQLSGGMERRVALARALVNVPRTLLLDEPLSSLDLPIRYALQNEIAAIHAREELTSILVTHDVDEALFLSDRVIVLSGTPACITHELYVAYPRRRDRSDSGYLTERNTLIEAVMRGRLSQKSHAEVLG